MGGATASLNPFSAEGLAASQICIQTCEDHWLPADRCACVSHVCSLLFES